MNDVDLRGIHEYTVARPESDRPCPLCNKAMETICITERETFYIERCVSCMGLFFDTNELDALLDHSVEHVYHIEHKKLWDLNQKTAARAERSVAYIKCPVCHKLMNRVNFGARSGVTVDQCNHGIWLDSGELRKLLAWRKAGGQLYYEKLLQERVVAEEKKRQRRAAGNNPRESFHLPEGSWDIPVVQHRKDFTKVRVVVGEVARVLWKLLG